MAGLYSLPVVLMNLNGSYRQEASLLYRLVILPQGPSSPSYGFFSVIMYGCEEVGL